MTSDKKSLVSPVQKNCEYCDGTGDVHDQIGEWRGTCKCEAGQALMVDLSKFKPENQKQMREWITDGSFMQRAIDTMFSLSEEITELKAAQTSSSTVKFETGIYGPFGSKAPPPPRPPTKRQWVGLTDEQKLSLEIQGSKADVMLAELVENWLKEKNT